MGVSVLANNFGGKRHLGQKLFGGVLLAVPLLISLLPQSAQAIPIFNRQTGQNCVACHAGGQFPELTPYGRLFKLTGYTIGKQTSLPLSAMVVASMSKVSNTAKSDDPKTDFAKNSKAIFATASLFAGGKITDNVGAFAQVTYDPYASRSDDGQYHSQTNVDNVDVRFADRLVSPSSDLIFGLSLNNNPSVSDPWNTAAAWMQYVPVPSPSSSSFIDGNTPYPGYGAGGNVAGITGYGFWNQTVYGELGAYRTARGLFSVMSAGIHNADVTRLRGLNPYWRLAYNHQWGPSSLMVGMAGMHSQVYDDPLDTSDASTTHHIRDINFDAQYQYLLDPHAVTAQFVLGRSHHTYPNALANQAVAFVDASGAALANTNTSDTTTLVRAKLSYVYQAKYGGSLALFNFKGSTNTFNQTSGFDPTLLAITSDPTAGAPSARVSGNLSGNPGTRGQTYEAFFMPIQNVRIGLQYTAYSRYNGASDNYDGFGRNARDNNSLFLYLWGAY